ncbi:hypothetical protein Ait01nite_031650 [Actinoplanes italicus]|uniref:P22-like antirepressor protein n=1 Tax=Actinoplanes italicus TaxID=113567 RepID=A0A2T0KJA8_9ACTN|nr:phage antirepressor N-terminal domain-containing protein [Actinoplanes italicus]PRX23620.1 P22-like antirepressor protein [Actinoplanes italicus]GIE30120.1 hypothetical protein Ait01nite_031650 [Actinoplanes italicus]
MTDLVRIPFHGGEVLAVDVDGKPSIFLKPVIESLGVDYSRQLQKLKAKSWACVGTMPMQLPGDIQSREHVVVNVRTFLMLLATIDERRVREEARQLLIAYQAEVADAIESYWTQGGAINPRATEDQLTAIATQAQAQMAVLAAARGIVDASWLEAKARHVAARALGEEPELDPMARPLTVGEFLQDKGLSQAELRSVSPRLGMRVKGLYVGEHGRMPDKVDRFVDGALRSVFAYTERDRPLFVKAWEAMSSATRSGNR